MPNPLIGIQMADGIFSALFRPPLVFGPAPVPQADGYAHECRIDDGDTEPCADCPIMSCPLQPGDDDAY